MYIVLTLVKLNITNIHCITQPYLKHVVEEILQCFVFIVPKRQLFYSSVSCAALTLFMSLIPLVKVLYKEPYLNIIALVFVWIYVVLFSLMLVLLVIADKLEVTKSFLCVKILQIFLELLTCKWSSYYKNISLSF